MEKKLKILFVDDEPNVIRGLKRMLFSLRKEWDQYFALSGEEALNIMQESEVDVVVSDMRMPKMNGAELLERIKEKYPKAVRIILSGYSDKELALKSTSAVHQFLAKPCDSEYLKKIVEKSFNLREHLHNENLLNFITGVGKLPSLPDVYLRLEEELNKEDASLNNVSKIISQDITMTAKILQLVNSAFFGLPANISSPMQAVNYLGINIIKSLVLYIKLFSLFKVDKASNIYLNELWNHSIKVGNLSKILVEKETSNKEMQEDAYIAGLLHDIGKLLVMSNKEYFTMIMHFMKENNMSYDEAEESVIGTTHADIGAYLLGLWGLPQRIVEAVAYHHKPSRFVNDNKFDSLSSVHIANTFAHLPNLDLNHIKNLGIENEVISLIMNKG